MHSKHTCETTLRKLLNLQPQIETLLKFGTFKEVKDVGQECVTSKWIIVAKQAHDGQKK